MYSAWDKCKNITTFFFHLTTNQCWSQQVGYLKKDQSKKPILFQGIKLGLTYEEKVIENWIWN